jgi:glycosyltransferase involved in cell wall biosynthesis
MPGDPRIERARTVRDVIPFVGGERESFRYIPALVASTASKTGLHRIAVLGNHLPRQCGIATFTTDLSAAIGKDFPALECFVLAMNDALQRHAYPERVRFEIAADDLGAYRRAAKFLNASDVDVLSVQHEYGIFGGPGGRHVLALLRDLRMPIVTTLHTILAEPDPAQRSAMDELTRISERLVVMSTDGAALLRRIHNVVDSKIDVIPHGIPSLPNPQRSRSRLGFEGKSVILTFGLLSPVKGIEHVIDALPAILERHPDTLYVVLGVTHPSVRANQGEAYRTMLKERAKSLGVDSSVIFHDKFVSQEELNEFLSAADIYITPYLDPNQSTSGTLAYAVGSGKAVVSTPYCYARELLSGGRGVIVPWPQDDPQGIEQAIIGLLSDGDRRDSLCGRGAAYGRTMLWPEVARAYVKSFESARAEHPHGLQTSFGARALAERPLVLPEIDLAHLRIMSDCTGLLQHAQYSVPRYEDGYCLDDNARALHLAMLLEDTDIEDISAVRALASRYLAFVRYALDNRSGRFKNFMSYSRQWVDEPGSEDSHGRALWALGSVVGRSHDHGQRDLADSLFRDALQCVAEFTSPRSWAFALLGIDEYLIAVQGDDEVRGLRERLADRLLELYRRVSTPDWPWFEERATYCNARLSHALILTGWRLDHDEMKSAGLRSLEWLVELQISPSGDDTFAPIGSNGFHTRGGDHAAFDQQPVEAYTMVSACLAARRVVGDGCWMADARRAFDWFLGGNLLKRPLYDIGTGGCRDGLHADRLNDNQGAESTLSFLLALVEMRAATSQVHSIMINMMGQNEDENAS